MFGGEKIIMKPINQTARITRISKRSCNKTCADCPEIHPTFVSIIKPQQCFALGSDALASFVCLQCASIHRKLGTDICFVRSINVDKWENKENDVNVADFTGNQIVNDIFEGHLKKALSNDANQSSAGTYSVNIKPLQGAHVASRERFIRQKYIKLYFYSKSSHYKHISLIMPKKKKQISLKGPQSPGKAVRKKLSIFLRNGNSDGQQQKQLKAAASASKSATDCSTTVGNTTTTTSIGNGTQEKQKQKQIYDEKCTQSADNDPLCYSLYNRSQRRPASRGRSRIVGKHRNKNGIDLYDEKCKRSADNDPLCNSLYNRSQRRPASRGRSRSVGKHRNKNDIDLYDEKCTRSADNDPLCNSLYNRSQRRPASRGRSRSVGKHRNKNGIDLKSKNKNRSLSRDENGTRGNSLPPKKQYQQVINTADTNKSRRRSLSRTRSSSKTSNVNTLDIRKKGQNSSSLRRRSRSSHRKKPSRHYNDKSSISNSASLDLPTTPKHEIHRVMDRRNLASPVSRGGGQGHSKSTERRRRLTNTGVSVDVSDATKLPLDEDVEQKMFIIKKGFNQNDEKRFPMKSSVITRNRSRSRKKYTTNSATDAPLFENSQSSLKNTSLSDMKLNVPERINATLEESFVRSSAFNSSVRNDLNLNADNSGEDDFRIISQSSISHSLNSKGSKLSWGNGLFSKPYENKKGSSTAKNIYQSRDYISREAKDAISAQRQCRKNDIFASMNRAELCGQKNEFTIDELRKCSRRTKSNDIVGCGRSNIPVKQSKLRRCKSSSCGSKTKMLMEEWEKIKNDDEIHFADFGTNFTTN